MFDPFRPKIGSFVFNYPRDPPYPLFGKRPNFFGPYPYSHGAPLYIQKATLLDLRPIPSPQRSIFIPRCLQNGKSATGEKSLDQFTCFFVSPCNRPHPSISLATIPVASVTEILLQLWLLVKSPTLPPLLDHPLFSLRRC